MSEHPKPSAVRLDDQDWAALRSAVRGLERTWQRDGAADLAQFVPPADDSLRGRVLVELIKVDQEYRWESKQNKQLEEYLEEWPELAGTPELVAELLAAECLTRSALSTTPTAEELETRFPGVLKHVDLAQIEAEVQSERGAAHQKAQESSDPDKSESGQDGTSRGLREQRLMKPGDSFGRYEVRELLGRGGMGSVYRAYDTKLDREVALKIPHFDSDVESTIAEWFLREARTAAKVRHPNVCPIHDVGQIDGTYYLAMALIDGQTLAAWMSKHAVSPLKACELLRKVASALARVHEAGIVHRDIKASNVMIDESGEPLLMDFGLAGLTKDDGHSSSRDQFLGTPAYMSPEQVRGKAADARSDVYGVGVLLYQLLTGKPPFDAPLKTILAQIIQGKPPRPRELRPDVDADLEAICLKAMAKRPADRFQSAKELAEALQRYIDKRPQATGPPPRHRPFVRTCAAAAAAVMLFAGVVIYLKTGSGTLELALNDADVKVTIDGEQIRIESDHVTATVAVGHHELEVSKNEDEILSESFTIRWRGDRIAAKVPPAPLDELPVRWIETEPNVMGIAVPDDGSTIYVAYWKDEEAPIQAFDASSGDLKKTIAFERQKHQPHGDVVISGDGRYIYTAHYYGRYMTRVDLQETDPRRNLDLTVDERYINVWTCHVGITPDKRKVVVPLGNGGLPDENNDQISVIDIGGDTFSLLAEVRLDDEPAGRSIGFSDDSQFAYVITRQRKSDGPCLYEIRLTPPCEVTRKLPFPEGDLRGVAVSSKLKRVFVSDSGHRRISVVDLTTFEPVSEIELDGHSPESLAVSPGQGLLVASCPATRKLFCVDAKNGTVVAHVDGLRDNMADPEFNSSGDLVFLANRGSEGGVAVVDLRHLTTWITFASNRDGESYQIYRMRANGRHPVRLTDTHATDRFPRWSPDGRKIAFVSDREGHPKIHIMDHEGKLISVLKDTDPFMGSVDWSPDGGEIAFIGNDRKEIRVVDVRTNAIRTLLEAKIGRGYSLITSLCWRATDGAILFGSQNPTWGHDGDIFQLNPLTREVRQITDEWGQMEYSYWPAASPDGSRIAVLRHLEEGPRQFEIFVMNREGTDLTRLTQDKDTLYAAAEWFPDSERIIYSAKVDRRYHIYAMHTSDGEPIQLTTGDWEDVDPDACDPYGPSNDADDRIP